MCQRGVTLCHVFVDVVSLNFIAEAVGVCE